eukprot:9974699-Alexandrium_andersonii.AAC.1
MEPAAAENYFFGFSSEHQLPFRQDSKRKFGMELAQKMIVPDGADEFDSVVGCWADDERLRGQLRQGLRRHPPAREAHCGPRE